MAAAKKDSTINYVHQTAILCETIKKEQNNQKFYTNYSINPFKKSKSMFLVNYAKRAYCLLLCFHTHLAKLTLA